MENHWIVKSRSEKKKNALFLTPKLQPVFAARREAPSGDDRQLTQPDTRSLHCCLLQPRAFATDWRCRSLKSKKKKIIK